MKVIHFLFVGLVCLFSVSAMAQKKVPYSFRYQAGPRQADTSGQGQLRFLTQVTQPTTTFLRLYFAGTQLGDNSYLVLEGTDGARQELRRGDLENWHYSSAYFNGQSVKVSLVAAAGERNTVHISEIKVADQQAGPTQNARRAAETGNSTLQTATSTPANLTATYPYAKAVGRFTNGTDSYGTGWIAPNGAIVTTHKMYDLFLYPDPYDVIEFNVPPSVGGTVVHPSPQDQYPLKKGTLPQSSLVYFKAETISTITFYGWVIFEPLPNGTGLRPGERQQEYFRIAVNPGNFTIDAQGSGNIPVEILHYGDAQGDNLQGRTIYRTLQVTPTSLIKQNDFLKSTGNGDRDRFVLHGMPDFLGGDGGAPITYAESNVAIGVHNMSVGDVPGITAYGLGFRDESFRNGVAQFFSAKSTYVDPEGLYNSPTGEIHKPYLSAQQAAQHASSNAEVYFAKGTYAGAVTFNRHMTLRAPVGKVVIGSSNAGARKSVASSTAQQAAMFESMMTLSRLENPETTAKVRAYPNPFKEQTEIKFPFADGGPVSVDVLNTAGVRVATFKQTNTEMGRNGVQWNGTDQNGQPVPTGLYLIRVNDGRQTFTTKVLKQ